ncbi:MAG: PAS domain S-box protein, partial [Candidatus Sulfotelmatobacter sp.]
ERKQAEQALQQSLVTSEAALKELADQKFALDQHAIVATTDVQGTITYVNDKFCAISKYSKEELIGQNHRILNSRHHSKEFFQQMYHTIANGQVWRGEICNRAKDGSIYWVDTTVVPLLDSGGKPRQYMAIRADITERKQAEQALQQSLVTSEAALKELADQKFALDQHAIVATTDVQGTITYVNDKFCTISGYSKDELLGRNHRILNSAHHPKEFFQQMYHAIANGQVWHDEICNRAKDGSLYWVDTTIVPLAAEDGKPRQYIAIRADVTQRKQAEVALVQKAEELALKSAELAGSREALESQTLMLQSVLDSMSEGLVATDTQGKFILWNPAAERIVGMGPAEMSPEQWTTHYGVYLPDAVTPFPPEQNPSLRAIHGEASAAEMFLKNRTLGGGIWIEINGSPLKDKNGVLRGGVAAFRDISRRRADEREIRKLNEELELRVATRTAELQSANKELEAFSYSISHDLRAPLRHISGFARIVIEDFAPSLPAEAQRHLQRIEQGAGRMGQLVDELLNLTRVGRQTLAVHATGLGSVVQDVITMLEPEIAGRQVQWKVAELPIVECDAILVRQVFQNLIGNALKYSRPRSPAVIEIGQTVKDGQTVIFVRDNGVGFSMKYADKLFGVFQRLHRAEDFEGTGVGLATVHRIVQKHGGQVWAEAEIDHGATFYFTLGTLARSESKALAANSGG